MVAESWSEITQDKIIRVKSDFMLRREKMLTSMRTLLDVPFLLSSWRSNQGWSFPFIRG
jgi:hypothetical protein